MELRAGAHQVLSWESVLCRTEAPSRDRGQTETFVPSELRNLRCSTRKALLISSIKPLGRERMRLSKGRHRFYVFLSELPLSFSLDYGPHLSSSHAFLSLIVSAEALISFSAVQELCVLCVSSVTPLKLSLQS